MEEPVEPAATLRITAFPNPFNPRTTIRFNLTEAQQVRLWISDLAGREQAKLADGFLRSGNHEIVWGGRDRQGRELASGVYFLSLQTEGHRSARKLVLLR